MDISNGPALHLLGRSCPTHCKLRLDFVIPFLPILRSGFISADKVFPTVLAASALNEGCNTEKAGKKTGTHPNQGVGLGCHVRPIPVVPVVVRVFS